MLVLDLTLSPFMALIVEALLRTARMVGVVSGGMVLVDAFLPQTYPVCRRAANARAWAVVGLGVMVGGALTLVATYGGKEPKVDATVARLILWVGISTGLVMRCACRAERPARIWLVATLIGITGFVLSLADAQLA